MSKPNQSRNLRSRNELPARAKKFAADFTSRTPVVPFIGDVPAPKPCDGWLNAHPMKDTSPGIVRPGTPKLLCDTCYAEYRKSIDSQHYPSADRAAMLNKAYGKAAPKAPKGKTAACDAPSREISIPIPTVASIYTPITCKCGGIATYIGMQNMAMLGYRYPMFTCEDCGTTLGGTREPMAAVAS